MDAIDERRLDAIDEGSAGALPAVPEVVEAMPVGGRAGRCSRAGDGSTASQYAVGVDAWMELSQAEYDDVWTRFGRVFAFRPSMHPKDWPGIREPTPSRTYRFEYPVDPLDEEDLCDSALRAFETVRSAR